MNLRRILCLWGKHQQKIEDLSKTSHSLCILKSGGVSPPSSLSVHFQPSGKGQDKQKHLAVPLTLLLYFSDVPDPPEDLQLSENQNRSVRLSWKAGATHNSPVNGRKGFPASLLGLFRILARVGCHRTQTLLTDWITLTTPVRLL